MSDTIALIMAAGEGKRMKSSKSKVLHQVAGRCMLDAVLTAAEGAGAKEKIVIVGHLADQVEKHVGDGVTCILQREQLGTGHAVMQASDFLANRQGTLLVLCGDSPIITGETLKKMIVSHKENKNSGTFMTVVTDTPFGYGRIMFDEKGEPYDIIEEKDCNEEQKKLKEINAGMYCFEIQDVLKALKLLKNDNAQGEYYLTDVMKALKSLGLKAGTFRVESFDEIMGVNDRVQLSIAEKIIRKRCTEKHMRNGVTIIDPENTTICENAVIGKDTILYPGTIIETDVSIGEDCVIGPNTRITESEIGNHVTVMNSVVVSSKIGSKSKVGPFAYLRPGSVIGKGVKIGDFVEVKNAVIGDKSSVSHLTYVGDADLGRNVNMGCGTVCVNYDGQKKYRVKVGDNSFIGCNTNLVAPVNVGENAFTAAGSTITEDVPDFALGIARERQINKLNWVKIKGKLRKEKDV